MSDLGLYRNVKLLQVDLSERTPSDLGLYRNANQLQIDLSVGTPSDLGLYRNANQLQVDLSVGTPSNLGLYRNANQLQVDLSVGTPSDLGLYRNANQLQVDLSVGTPSNLGLYRNANQLQVDLSVGTPSNLGLYRNANQLQVDLSVGTPSNLGLYRNAKILQADSPRRTVSNLGLCRDANQLKVDMSTRTPSDLGRYRNAIHPREDPSTTRQVSTLYGSEVQLDQHNVVGNIILQMLSKGEHISHPGYYTYRKDRNTKGGGIIIMAKRCFSQGISDEELFSRTSGIEAMMLNVGGVNVINVYAPPGCIIREDDLPITTKSIIAGDFNAHNLVWSTRTTKSGKELFNWAGRNDVLVANRPGQITRPKHDIPGGGTSPDVIFFKGSIVLEEFPIINEDSKHNSDHRPLLAILDTMAHLSQATVGARKRTVWDFKSTNWSAFRQQLDRRIDRAKFSDDATGNVGLLNNIIHEVAARNVRRRILFKGKRRRKWKTSSPESLKSKGSHLKDQLKKGNNFNFAFKKIKELQQDAGKDISVSNISENDLPAAFLDQLHLLVGCPSQKLDAARYEILGFSTLTGKWDRSSDLILINGIPASLGSIFATSWLPSVAMLIRWMEQASNLRLWNCVGDT